MILNISHRDHNGVVIFEPSASPEVPKSFSTHRTSSVEGARSFDLGQPATLKNANMNTKTSGICGSSQVPTCTKKPPPNRVIADARQLVILKSLWQCGPNPTKEHVLRAVRDTGL